MASLHCIDTQLFFDRYWIYPIGFTVYILRKTLMILQMIMEGSGSSSSLVISHQRTRALQWPHSCCHRTSVVNSCILIAQWMRYLACWAISSCSQHHTTQLFNFPIPYQSLRPCRRLLRWPLFRTKALQRRYITEMSIILSFLGEFTNLAATWPIDFHLCTVPCLCVLCYDGSPNLHTVLCHHSSRAEGEQGGVSTVRAKTRARDQTVAETEHVLKHDTFFDMEGMTIQPGSHHQYKPFTSTCHPAQTHYYINFIAYITNLQGNQYFVILFLELSMKKNVKSRSQPIKRQEKI